MATRYRCTYGQGLAALSVNAELFAKLVVDALDAASDLGAFEPIGDMAKPELINAFAKGVGYITDPINSGHITCEGDVPEGFEEI